MYIMIIIFIILHPTHVMSHAKKWSNSYNVHLCPQQNVIHVKLKCVMKKYLYRRTRRTLAMHEDSPYGLPRETMQFVPLS